MSIPADHRPASLSSLSDDERTLALARFQILRPFLEDGVPLARVAQEQNVILRTARRWVRRYRREGLAGLARKERSDRAQRNLSTDLQQLIEGLALSKPRLSVATIHRQVVEAAQKRGESRPSARRRRH
jgi:putative transposase